MPTPSKKSCAGWDVRHSKARCSLTAPVSTRCASRNINCDYSEARKVSIDHLRKRKSPHNTIAEIPELPESNEVSTSVSGTVESIQDEMPDLNVLDPFEDVEDIEAILPGLHLDLDSFLLPRDFTSTPIIPQHDTSWFTSSVPKSLSQIFEPNSYTGIVSKKPCVIPWTVSSPWPDPKKLLHENYKFLSRRSYEYDGWYNGRQPHRLNPFVVS